jgi:hypothetical protein
MGINNQIPRDDKLNPKTKWQKVGDIIWQVKRWKYIGKSEI